MNITIKIIDNRMTALAIIFAVSAIIISGKIEKLEKKIRELKREG